MKEKITKPIDQRLKAIVMRWIVIFVIQTLMFIIGPYIVKVFVKQEVFKWYYQQFATELLGGPMLILVLIGLLINILIYFLRSKRYKVAIILIVIIG